MQVVFQAPHHFKRNFITAAGYFLSNTQQILNALIYVAPNRSKKRVLRLTSSVSIAILCSLLHSFQQELSRHCNTNFWSSWWCGHQYQKFQWHLTCFQTSQTPTARWPAKDMQNYEHNMERRNLSKPDQYVSSPTILYHKKYFKTICDSTKLTFMFLMEIIAFPKLSNFIFLSQL